MNLVEISAGDTRATIVPERGAIVTSLSVAGRELLYLDHATLPGDGNVRGGIPVLFPTPGKLQGDAWQWQGKSGTLPQHGFARRSAFNVVGRLDDRLSLRLDWNARDSNAWPWACSLELDFVISARTLRIEQRIANQSHEAMPFGIGFHPYFAVPQASKAATRIPTRATRAFDNVTKREVPLRTKEPKIDLSLQEVDMHLLDHGGCEASLIAPDGKYIHLRGSPEMRRWVIWTLADRDFVCLEPWSCPGNAINTGQDVIVLQPQERRTLSLALSLTHA